MYVTRMKGSRMTSSHTALLLFCRRMLHNRSLLNMLSFLSNKQNRLKFKLFNFFSSGVEVKTITRDITKICSPLEFCSILCMIFGEQEVEKAKVKTMYRILHSRHLLQQLTGQLAQQGDKKFCCRHCRTAKSPVMRCPGLSPCHWLKQALPAEEKPSPRHTPGMGYGHLPLRLWEMPAPCTDGNSGLAVKDVLGQSTQVKGLLEVLSRWQTTMEQDFQKLNCVRTPAMCSSWSSFEQTRRADLRLSFLPTFFYAGRISVWWSQACHSIPLWKTEKSLFVKWNRSDIDE